MIMVSAIKTMKDSAWVRWTTLVLISLVMFSSYYFYDVFSSIKNTLQAEVGLSNTEYGTMYGAYSLTNSILLMAFLGGIILDRWGIRKTGTLFISFMVIGTFLTTYGASDLFKTGSAGYKLFGSFMTRYSPQLKLMIFGRILFGLGAETFYVVINKIIAKWFKGKELALAFGISLAFGRFGTAGALLLSPRLINSSIGWTAAGWFGFMLMLIALMGYITFSLVDGKYDRQLRRNFGVNVEESLRLKDIFSLFKNRSFIYITLLCVTFYSAVFPFMPYAADLMLNKFGIPEAQGGMIVTILPFGTILFTPIFGWWCDNKGHSASLMILGSVLLIFVYLTLSLTHMNPYIPLFFLGVAFSLVPAAMWPAVARIVKEKQLGTAYGTMFTVQNYGLMLVPVFLGLILDKTNPGVTAKTVSSGEAMYNYTWAMLFLVILGVLGIVFALLLKREDKTSGFGLEKPNRENAE